MRGVYREVTPPERLVTTESWGGDWPETLNMLTLSGRMARQRRERQRQELRDPTGMNAGAVQ